MVASRTSSVLALLLLAGCGSVPDPTTGTAPAFEFRRWSADAFAEAKAEHKLVLLDLGTTWCHWCHVMAQTTYADAAVRAVLAAHFVAIEEDADRRLDLAARYQDFGWPATVVFDADGRELWKNRGYVPPERMHAVLQRLVADPSPLPAVAIASATTAAAALDEATRGELRQRLAALRDGDQGGFGFVHKYLDLAGAEWLLLQAQRGDEAARDDLQRWLAAERQLHDPVWGGAYQYSHGGVWTNPHFEKVMVRQLADLRAYSLAYGCFGDREHLTAAQNVARFLTGMLRAPNGAFYASQDADLVRGEHAAEYFARDDAGRRAAGLPHIETSIWSRENGQALQGLCALLAVAPDDALLATVREATDWLLRHRRRYDGLFRHDAEDRGGPFLADSLEMATALAALAEVTADAQLLSQARQTVLAIDATLRAPAGGHATALGDVVLPPIVDRGENLQLARLGNRLFHATGDARLRAIAERAFAGAAAQAAAPGASAELLLADDELGREPVHVVVTGARDDAAAVALHRAALRHAPNYRRIDWVVPGEPPLRSDTPPAGDVATAFVCADGACSAPLHDPTALRTLLLAPSAAR
ncbi:MAG: thioredoxin domain-containing protein [Planctomycetes bacterium]|nr:thioredoxin domain-containing protein [Planctomycetota bacterium]